MPPAHSKRIGLLAFDRRKAWTLTMLQMPTLPSFEHAAIAVGKRVRILLVDDHHVVRQGIRLMLADRPDFEICGEAASGEAAIDYIMRLTPDIVILDVNMPGMNGFEVARRVKEFGLEGRIVMFSMHDSPGFIVEARNVGALGFVRKSEAGQQLVKAVDAVFAGQTFFPTDSAKPPQHDN
jgi:DNA-binding NarL/FixJ family response regulator